MSSSSRIDGIPSDQPSILYGFDGDDGEELREIARSGHGRPGPSPGDVVRRESTRSELSDSLPELDLPGRRGLGRDDCGEDIPAFACEDCGHPKYAGRTCYSPTCERCWAAWVKRQTVTVASKLEGLRKRLNAKHDAHRNKKNNHDFNHVVASLPSVRVNSEEPTEQILKILKEIAERNWQIEGFYAIYHPYRIKQEFRKDQYEHGGESGDGDMTWKDVLNAENPEQYIKFEPHFHLFFPAKRKSFDYLTAEGVYEESGWLFHRITKGPDSNVSVADFEDLVHQMTYCLSHAGIAVPGEHHDGQKATSITRMKGLLHNTYAPDGAEDRALAAVCEAAPRLLGYSFANTKDASCDANPDGSDSTSPQNHTPDPRSLDDHPSSPGFRNGQSPNDWVSSNASTSASDGVQPAPVAGRSENHRNDSQGESGGNSPACGGGLVPMNRVEALLSDPDWCDQAAYVDPLRTALDEWQRRRTEDSPPDDRLH